jgi:hypothetical protein
MLWIHFLCSCGRFVREEVSNVLNQKEITCKFCGNNIAYLEIDEKAKIIKIQHCGEVEIYNMMKILESLEKKRSYSIDCKYCKKWLLSLIKTPQISRLY